MNTKPMRIRIRNTACELNFTDIFRYFGGVLGPEMATMLEEIDLKLRDLLDIGSKPMSLGGEADKIGTVTGLFFRQCFFGSFFD